MTRALLLTALPLLVFPAGCASRAKVRAQEEEISQLKRQLAVVQREQTEMRAKNDHVSDLVFILTDRVDTQSKQMARTTQAPPKLEVVKLVPQPSADPLAPRVKTVKPMPTPDPLDAEGYDPSADEAEMFSFSDDDAAAARSSDVIALPSPPRSKPVKVAAASPTTLPDSLADTSTSRPKEDPMAMYQRAFGLFQAKNLGDAILAFEEFVRANPAHEYADNAFDWMGECFYGQGEYALAISEFQKVPELYPGGNKVPDSLLKIGLSYLNLSNTKNAEKTLRQLVDAYPQSEAAKIAKQKLEKLK